MVRSEERNMDLVHQICALKQDFSQEKQQLQRALETLSKEYESVKTELAAAKLKVQDDVKDLFQQLQSKETGMLAFEKEKHDLQHQLSQLEQDLIQGKQQQLQQSRDLEILAKENEELRQKLAAVKKRNRLILSQKV